MSQKTYRIGEAAAKLKLKSYVLRFWETEFSQIAPVRTEKGQRLYRESDLAVLGRIRFLLHERGLTIDGARRLLQEEAAKGTLYTAANMLSLGPDDGDENCPDDEEALSGAHDGQPSEPERHPVQGSLLPSVDNRNGRSLPENDVQSIMDELAAIRRILVRNPFGDIV